MDDDQLDVKQEGGEEATIEESSTVEDQASEEVETPVEEATAEPAEETEAETEETPKKGAQNRIRELNQRAKTAEGKVKSLETRLAELTSQVDKPTNVAPYTPQIEPGKEYDSEQLKQEFLKTADSIATLRVKQSESINRIKSESSQLLRDYPELDPDSDSFDQELSDSITEATEAYVMANPYTASPKKLVDKLMKPFKRAAVEGVGKAKENLAKQVSQAATRPTAVSKKSGKTDGEKSIAELEKELGFYN